MEYLCTQCEDGGCILGVDPEPTRLPFNCPWESKAKWEKQNVEASVVDCNFKTKKDNGCLLISSTWNHCYCSGPDCILQRILKGQEKECNCDENQKFADKVPLEEWKTITWYCPRHGNQKR